MRKRSFGCVGCLVQVVLILLVVGAVVIAGERLFAPWAFYLGGRAHLTPYWQGVGTANASSGTYVVYVSMAPQPGGGLLHLPYWRGWASLCTPRGETYRLRLSAEMFEHPGTDTNGQRMRIDMYNRTMSYVFSQGESRPRLEFRGRWENPNLVMNDGGTLSRAFLPDGSLYLGPTRNQPKARETVAITFHEVPWWTWSGCRSSQ